MAKNLSDWLHEQGMPGSRIPSFVEGFEKMRASIMYMDVTYRQLLGRIGFEKLFMKAEEFDPVSAKVAEDLFSDDQDRIV